MICVTVFYDKMYEFLILCNMNIHLPAYRAGSEYITSELIMKKSGNIFETDIIEKTMY